MILDTSSVPELSGQQRRCNMLLMLFMPSHPVQLQLDAISQLNGVELAITRQDVAEVTREIQRFYHLDLDASADNNCRIYGSRLDKRLCFIHYLRRGLRYCPHFVENHFAPRLYQALAWHSGLWSEFLPQIVSQCEPYLNRQLNKKDHRLLQLYLAYCAWEHQQQTLPNLSEAQKRWLAQKPAYAAADNLFISFNQLLDSPLDSIERDMLVLMLTMIKAHNYHSTQSRDDIRLLTATKQLIKRFQRLSGMPFSDDDALISQLFAHLAPAIERCYFNIGIDSLPQEISDKYPRLLRITQQALIKFELEYQIQFSLEEVGLIAISFGAWLMQGKALQEKQVILLTHNNPLLEAQVEQQIRELTLLPLHIKYLPHDVYLQQGAPLGATLVLTPYAIRQVESTPPLIQIYLPLTYQQSSQLLSLLELP